jgi:predicted metal-dependent hydrolase
MPAAQMAFDFAQPRSTPRVPPSVVRGHARPARSAGPAERTALQSSESRARTAVRFDQIAERIRAERKLEQRLSQLMNTEVALRLTDNGRTMLSARDRDGIAHVRLHHMFAQADDAVMRAVARFLREGNAADSADLQRFIRRHGTAIRRRVNAVRVRARGHHHDLLGILDQVNADYFQAAAEVRISWGRMGRAMGRSRKRRSIKLGSYRSRDALIRVHPVLDAAWVPRFFVEYIVYHELLHHVLGMPVKNGRRDLHGPEFQTRERMFALYAEAIAWEQQHLDRLLLG